MRMRFAFSGLSFPALFLIVALPAIASSTWYVDGTNGSDSNDCKSSSTACKTIGHAISLAASGDSIRVASGTYKENLFFSNSLAIRGASAPTTIIDGGARYTVVSILSTTANVTLSGLTIRNGLGGGNGGGIANNGTLTISNSAVSGNTTLDRCEGSRCFALGGGIYNNKGVLTISNSTISGNTVACAGPRCHSPTGGGIFNNQGRVTINNSTFNGNTAKYGGGIYGDNTAVATISNSTITGNSGGGIYDTGLVTLQNSIIADNTGGNCIGTVASNGFNLSSDATCNFGGSGDMNNTDPRLGPLQNNGGPTQTMALLGGSPAIDAGNPRGCIDGAGHLLKTDQRGKPRPDPEETSGCDIGAYERQGD